MTLHPLLVRQLKKLGLSADKAPFSLEQWQLHLQKISGSYLDSDQDRYLNERSLEISSRELSDLNQKLESSQHLVHLGYWFYHAAEDKVLWSKETYELFGYDPLMPPPKHEELIKRVHVDDRKKLENAIKAALHSGEKYEIEIRYLFGTNNNIRWFRCIGGPELPASAGQPIKELSGVVLDITSKKQSEKEIAELNEQLVDAAKRAGMSEIATAVLHNIGNVLNSVNVSVEIAEENLNRFNFKKIDEIAIMLETHLPKIQEYLTVDPKGKLIPRYLKNFATLSNDLHKSILEESHALAGYIRHIRDIIAAQYVYTGISGTTDKVEVKNALDSALQISGVLLDNKGILIEKNYEDSLSIITNKSKLFQILVNLIQNAKDAVMEASNPEKKIKINYKKTGDNEIKILVKDNGIGIPNEKLTSIFRLGFTSKKHGHGIGLHSCAVAAQEMGGSLKAESEGINKGSTFTLTLPIKILNKNSSRGVTGS